MIEGIRTIVNYPNYIYIFGSFFFSLGTFFPDGQDKQEAINACLEPLLGRETRKPGHVFYCWVAMYGKPLLEFTLKSTLRPQMY